MNKCCEQGGEAESTDAVNQEDYVNMIKEQMTGTSQESQREVFSREQSLWPTALRDHDLHGVLMVIGHKIKKNK